MQYELFSRSYMHILTFSISIFTVILNDFFSHNFTSTRNLIKQTIKKVTTPAYNLFIY